MHVDLFRCLVDSALYDFTNGPSLFRGTRRDYLRPVCVHARFTRVYHSGASLLAKGLFLKRVANALSRPSRYFTPCPMFSELPLRRFRHVRSHALSAPFWGPRARSLVSLRDESFVPARGLARKRKTLPTRCWGALNGWWHCLAGLKDVLATPRSQSQGGDLKQQIIGKQPGAEQRA